MKVPTKKIIIISVILIAIINQLNIWSIYAEPYYFEPKMIEMIKYETIKTKNILSKLEYIDGVIKKIDNIDNNKKIFVLRDINKYRNEILTDNLKEYVKEKYLSWSMSEDILKKWKKQYQILKIKDIKSDMHPNYLNIVENSIKNKLEINENSNEFYVYVYMLKNINDENDFADTEEILKQADQFWKTEEYNKNKDYYDKKFEKLIKFENANKYSNNDYIKVLNTIVKEKISPNSDYMKWFLAWNAKYSKIIQNSKLEIDTEINHEKQKYSLSCEANSAKDLSEYLYLKWLSKPMTEDVILESIPSNTGWITVNEKNEIVWHDPNKVFVWALDWKQSASINNFTWYWVYADPIISALKKSITQDIELKKSSFDEQEIIDSLYKWRPIVFWYLSQVKKWKWYWYNTKSVNWRVDTWEVIVWYIWEHTWIITWMDFTKDWMIDNIYFYEWKNINKQKMSFENLKELAKYFNQMIVIDDNINNT